MDEGARPSGGRGRASPALLALLLFAGGTRASAAPTPQRPPALTPERYKDALAPVKTCDDFFRRAGTLPDATPLLRSMLAGGIPAKGRSESDDAFLARVVRILFQRLGDPSRLVTGLPLDGAVSAYDPAARTVTVTLAQPLEATLDRWRERPDRGAGGTRRYELRAGYGFPAGAMPRQIALPMTAEEAARFRAGSGRLVILSLFQDYGTDQGPATGGAGGLPTRYQLVRFTPKCAIFVDGAGTIPGWRFDGWTAAPNAE